MKKSNLFYLGLFAIIFTLSSCGTFDDESFFGCINGEGPSENFDFNIDGFDGVKLKGSGTLYLTQGSDFAVTVKGQENIVDEVILDVDNNILNIGLQGCYRNFHDLEYYITMPEVKALTIDGSGEIYGETPIEGNSLDLNIKGSGDMDIEFTGDDVEGFIDGSGSMKLEGEVEAVRYEIQGSGDIEGFNMSSKDANIEIKASGNVEVNASEYLKIKISGSGDVYYKGNPVLDVEVLGSGDVIKKN